MTVPKPSIFTLDYLLSIGQTFWFWCSMVITCLSLEAGALFYQHALGLEPCELCIYVRVWVAAITLVSVLALVLRQSKIARIVLSLMGITLSIGLANESWNLLVVEYNIGSGGTCGFFANFPSWAPLDKWFPDMFEVREFCQATPIIFWKISMAHSISLTSAGFISAFLLTFIGAIKPAKSDFTYAS